MNHINLVSIRLGRRVLEVERGTSAGELLDVHHQGTLPVLAAIVDQRCVDLSTPITADTQLRPVDYSMREGVLVYRRTASLILLEAVRRLFGGVGVSIGQAMGNGYFYEIRTEGGFTPAQHRELEREMQRLVEQDIPLRTEERSLTEARRIFSQRGDDNKLRLLETWWKSPVTLVYCGEFCDLHHYPVAPSTGYIAHYELVYDAPGVLLRFPQRRQPDYIEPLTDSPKLKQAYLESRRWLDLLGVKTVGQLNAITLDGSAGELIRVAEGLDEKKIAHIADQICDSGRDIRLVLIAGPSSSGKTTFSKRLSLQLRVNGIQPVGLSTDNFYVDRVDTPKDGDGQYDFEALEAIDLPTFNDVLRRLLHGEEVSTPRFDFTTGERKPPDKWTPMRLERDQVLLVEGIHGLNPKLTSSVPEEQKFRIYINALTQLCIDDHNRIFTSDTRLLRRIVRDRMFRGYTAAQTIANWPRVRRGEQRWIYPFQEAADALFNSALVYEPAVLRLYAERFLLEVPHDHPSFTDAARLLQYVEYFVPMFDETIPQTSLLCEFIGGSYFDY